MSPSDTNSNTNERVKAFNGLNPAWALLTGRPGKPYSPFWPDGPTGPLNQRKCTCPLCSLSYSIYACSDEKQNSPWVQQIQETLAHPKEQTIIKGTSYGFLLGGYIKLHTWQITKLSLKIMTLAVHRWFGNWSVCGSQTVPEAPMRAKFWARQRIREIPPRLLFFYHVIPHQLY